MRESGNLAGLKTSLSGDYLKSVPDASDEDRLYHAMTANRSRKFLELRSIEGSPWLLRVRINLFDRKHVKLSGGRTVIDFRVGFRRRK